MHKFESQTRYHWLRPASASCQIAPWAERPWEAPKMQMCKCTRGLDDCLVVYQPEVHPQVQSLRCRIAFHTPKDAETLQRVKICPNAKLCVLGSVVWCHFLLMVAAGAPQFYIFSAFFRMCWGPSTCWNSESRWLWWPTRCSARYAQLVDRDGPTRRFDMVLAVPMASEEVPICVLWWKWAIGWCHKVARHWGHGKW